MIAVMPQDAIIISLLVPFIAFVAPNPSRDIQPQMNWFVIMVHEESVSPNPMCRMYCQLNINSGSPVMVLHLKMVIGAQKSVVKIDGLSHIWPLADRLSLLLLVSMLSAK
jgi:hypothetical protein